MQALVERIEREGRNLGRGILKVDGFINHQLDPALTLEMGRSFARRFAALGVSGVTKIITAEVSGIAPALTTGIVLGVLVSISSVGAGALGVSALFFLYPRLPTLRIVGSDIAHAVPLTLVAGIGHWFLGSVDWSLLGSLLIGSLPGIWLGSHVSTRVPDRVLRPILATMLVLVGSKLIAA